MTPPLPGLARVDLFQRLGVALFLLALAGGGSAAPVCAQDAERSAALPQHVTLVAVGVPLREALEGLIDRTRIALAYDNALVAGRTAFCRTERAPVEQALACVLEDTGLDYARLSSGTYTLFVQREATPRWGTLTGEVVDAETGAPLAGAHIVLAVAAEGATQGMAANAAGRFALVQLLPGTHRLVVTHVGYREAELTVRVEADRADRVAVALRPEPVLAAPLVVSGLKRRALSERLGEGRLNIEAAAIETNLEGFDGTPSPTLTPDVAGALAAVVGVRAGEALADVHVQGGAVDEHAFLLDGAPVLVPVSLGGLVGPFSPFALARVVVRKAGYGAMHGSTLAGVVDVESAEAPPGAALAVQIDPLSANVRWGGRAGRATHVEGAWSLAVRQGLWGVTQPPALADRLRSWSTPDAFLIDRLGQEAPPEAASGFPVDLGFTDAHAAGRLRFGGLRSLHGSLYLARHAFGVEDVGLDGTPSDELYEDAYRWTNHTGQLRYEWVQGSRAFGHVGAWSSSYHLRRPGVLGSEGSPRDFNGIDAVGLRGGLDVAATLHHTVTTEFELTHYDADGDLGLLGTSGGLDGGRLRWTLAGAAEDRIALGAQAVLTLGARLTWLPERQALHSEPRIALRVDGAHSPLGPWAFRVAAGRYLQYLTAVDVADGGPAPLLPRIRFWLPLGADERPPEAYHLAAETLVQPAAGWEAGIEAYVKHQPHLLVPDYGGTSGRSLTGADGLAYGFALHADRRTDRVRVSGAYEFAVARRRTPDRFGGNWTPTPWSAPHRLRASADVLPLSHLTLTVRAETVLGRTWGFRQAYYDLLEPGGERFAPFDLSEPGAHRLPAFVQLDFSAAYTTTVRGVGVQARLGLLNALGRDNVRDWLLAYDDAAETYVQRPRYAMPLLPIFALRLTY